MSHTPTPSRGAWISYSVFVGREARALCKTAETAGEGSLDQHTAFASANEQTLKRMASGDLPWRFVAENGRKRTGPAGWGWRSAKAIENAVMFLDYKCGYVYVTSQPKPRTLPKTVRKPASS